MPRHLGDVPVSVERVIWRWRFLSPACKHAGASQAKKGTTEMKSRTKRALRAVPTASVQIALPMQEVLADVQNAFLGRR